MPQNENLPERTDGDQEPIPFEVGQQGTPSHGIVPVRGSLPQQVLNVGGIPVETRFVPKDITIAGQPHHVSPQELCRLIMNITQQIGEAKRSGNVYSAYVISALRQARNNIVSDLERHFRIGWKVNENGNSVFHLL